MSENVLYGNKRKVELTFVLALWSSVLLVFALLPSVFELKTFKSHIINSITFNIKVFNVSVIVQWILLLISGYLCLKLRKIKMLCLLTILLFVEQAFISNITYYEFKIYYLKGINIIQIIMILLSFTMIATSILTYLDTISFRELTNNQ